MRKIFLTVGIFLSVMQLTAQEKVEKANYQMAARFAPRKLDKMIFSTSVDPHWLKKSDRFWYVYETPQGKNWYIVDPAKGEKKQLFDRDRMAGRRFEPSTAHQNCKRPHGRPKPENGFHAFCKRRKLDPV